jgi:tRNA(Ile)-lysidine synthetase-like protein
VRCEQLVEFFQRAFDLGIGAVDELLDGMADLVLQDLREILHGAPSFLLLLGPFDSLLLGLAFPPGLKELGHLESIGDREGPGNPSPVYPVLVDTDALRERVEELIRRHDLIEPGGDVICLVSGGADSTFLWHALTKLGYGVSALHVNHGLRGSASDEDARFCAEHFGAQVVDGSGGLTEDDWRRIRYSFATDRLRATGHTASDQVETILYKLVASGVAKGIKLRREDGVVRPLLSVWREETEEYCRAERLEFRLDESNSDTKRGLIRDEILPRLRELHPAAERNLLRFADGEPTALDELLASTAGSRRLDLGAGLTAVREYDRVWLERTPVSLDGQGEVRWGEWRIASKLSGLKVRAWRAGDRLAGRSKKIQDVFVDAKIPRSSRESWPLVVRGDEVVAVPGIVEAEGVLVERVPD